MANPQELNQLLQQAMAHHQAGRLAEADALYRQMLALQPEQPDAMHLLGVLYHQAGHSQQGVELIRRAVTIAPTPANLSNLGEVLRATGRAAESLEFHNRAVAQSPNWVDGHANLGLALMDLGRYADAEKAFDSACRLAPRRADLWVRLCRARDRSGDPHGAVQAGRKAYELSPDSPEAVSYLALALSSAKKFDEAIELATKAVALAPNRPETHLNLGLVYTDAGRLKDAEAEYLRSVEIDPNFAHGHRTLAALLDQMNEVERSIAAAERSLALVPNDIEARVNLSGLYRRAKDYKASLANAEKAVALIPSHPGAHGALGFALLHLGDYKRGFSEYEWRWRCENFTTPLRELPGSVWDGSDPRGRTILVHPEQGFGDTIQFARYIPMLIERGAKVIVETWSPLRALMATVKGVSRVCVCGVKPPEYDLHFALLSLPKIFGTTIETIPQEVPYFHPEPERTAFWKHRIESAGGGVKVGLVWAGNAKPDPMRTCPIANLAPLAAIDGVTFISLQNRKNPFGSEPPPPGMTLVDVWDDLKDFHETAAAMAQLDLIITIDTGAAHLAGAMGRPTFTMLPYAADWRWLDDREDSVWYPTMRLFRQKTRGDWAPVVQQVADRLRAFVNERQ